ncbi:esterase-like activity of phytase family protein [Actinoplanes sp. NPDC049316]|uniref:esterase-like activity of phytase family protein n=1 Tax=Actinoplanes sp. NPDC049316 TaxID=3154727 RepID=UPI00341302F4
MTDSAYTPTRLLTVETATRPATITRELTVTRDGEPVGYDAEGVAALRNGGYWPAVEPSLLVRLDAAGRVREEVPLPGDIRATITSNGLEGIAVSGDAVWVAVQRPLKGETTTRIGRYAHGTWSWLAYPLDAAPTGWTGAPGRSF